jgi:hypothetical protein
MQKDKKRLFQDRIDFEKSLTKKQIRSLLHDGDLKVLQCSRPVETQTWDLLNDIFFSKRADVQLRVYGFYKHICDLSFTSRMTNVCHFSADSLRDVVGVHHLASMENLESLGIGIYHLESFDFLNQVKPRLKSLFLGQTKSKKPDLSPLIRFESLNKIYIEGHKKHIEVLSEIPSLQDVTLRSISTPDISFLKPLHRMWSLDIKLGGITDLSAIAGMESIKYLELWQVRGLSDISVISTLLGLQFLFLQSLRRVTAIPSLTRLKQLRRIYLENMKGLEDIKNLEFAPALEEFTHSLAQNMQPEDYLPLLRNQNIKKAAVWFGSDKRNNRFEELMREHEIEPMQDFREFKFF